MPRLPKPPTPWQSWWHDRRRIILALLFTATVLSGVFVSIGLAALLFLLTLGLATFASGPPTHNGPVSPPSMEARSGGP